MDKVWYLFKSSYHRIKDDKFVQYGLDYYDLYNARSKKPYLGDTSLIRALKTKRSYAKSHKALFVSPSEKSSIIAFESWSGDYSLDDYYQILADIRNNVSNIEIGEPFIDKVPVFSDLFYNANKCSLKTYIDPIYRIKKSVEDKNSSLITDEDREYLKTALNWFLSVTLLYVSQRKPTFEDIKKTYPELLV